MTPCGPEMLPRDPDILFRDPGVSARSAEDCICRANDAELPGRLVDLRREAWLVLRNSDVRLLFPTSGRESGTASVSLTSFRAGALSFDSDTLEAEAEPGRDAAGDGAAEDRPEDRRGRGNSLSKDFAPVKDLGRSEVDESVAGEGSMPESVEGEMGESDLPMAENVECGSVSSRRVAGCSSKECKLRFLSTSISSTLSCRESGRGEGD